MSRHFKKFDFCSVREVNTVYSSKVVLKVHESKQNLVNFALISEKRAKMSCSQRGVRTEPSKFGLSHGQRLYSHIPTLARRLKNHANESDRVRCPMFDGVRWG